MKKYLLILPLIILSFLVLLPVKVSATSGACSYHSGVNCSAGASSTGKVQCNDGWINSSVYFYDAEECKQKSSCVYPTYSSCDVERAKQEAQKRAEESNNSNRAMDARAGLLGSPMQRVVDWTQDPNYILCKSTQALYQAGQDYYFKCIADESKTWEDNFNKEYQPKFNTICVQENGIGSVWNKSIEKDIDGMQCYPTKKQKDATCKKDYGNSYYSVENNNCPCNDGNVIGKNGQCVPLSNWCSETYGLNTYVKDGKCLCSDGYSYDDTLKTCKILGAKQEIIQPVMVKKEPVNNPKKSNTIFTPTKLKATEKEIPQKPVNIPFTMRSIQPAGTGIYNSGLLNNNEGIDAMKLRFESNTTTQTNPEPVKKVHWYQKIFNWFK